MTGNSKPPFEKVLIANRGEIAVRVIRACQDLRIPTVAVYSELDQKALHVRLADEAYALGGETASESYLNTEKIVEILKISGADAVHPGYGFFSENADFAREITSLGITFVGPPPEAIEVMGDKISARAAAAKVGVEGVPGNTNFLSDAKQVIAFGAEHGWPIAIKAAFGGGGRGMKVVNAAEEATDALESAQREALAYFGRDDCYVERYLTNPRHIEVQVVFDEHGNGVYLGTRDCSAQRRHQKLVEEAPAPELSPEVVAAMGADAVKVGAGSNYTNAGTVEYLYQDGEYFYLEMNTRLQVEHPVTEIVTGVDLVALQLQIAAGQKLPFSQEDVVVENHAIEIRINAEDPAGGAFLPSPGQIEALRVPSGYGVRWDGGYEAGDTVSQFYDNLIGKLICWGPDRKTAIARTLRALAEFEINGVRTTIPADELIVGHPDFAATTHSTKWVESTLDLSSTESTPLTSRSPDGVDGRVRRSVEVEVEGKLFSVAVWVPEAASGTPGSKPKTQTTAVGGTGEIVVPMQGTVVKVPVEIGDDVEVGDTVLVIEAMKMENNIAADTSGKVSEVRVSVGDSVSGGDIVIKIDASS